MKAIRLFRHPACAKCARYARMHHRFDWLDRLDDSTDVPPTGPLRFGEIAVQDLATGEMFKGVACFALLCRHIPAYRPMLLLLRFAPVRKMIEREVGGCADTC